MDGKWSVWSSWSVCSTPCGEGLRERFRTCTDPPPDDDGLPCKGKSLENVTCNKDVVCPGNHHWFSGTGINIFQYKLL